MRETIPARVVLVCDRCEKRSAPFMVSERPLLIPGFGETEHSKFEVAIDCCPLDLCTDCCEAIRRFACEKPPASSIQEIPLPPGFQMVATNNPCLLKLKEGEPYFVLRGQDRIAAKAVRLWAEAAKAVGAPEEKWAGAMDVALQFDQWEKAHGTKTPD